MQKRSGFTLIELTVVIALLAILTAVCVPNLFELAAEISIETCGA